MGWSRFGLKLPDCRNAMCHSRGRNCRDDDSRQIAVICHSGGCERGAAGDGQFVIGLFFSNGRRPAGFLDRVFRMIGSFKRCYYFRRVRSSLGLRCWPLPPSPRRFRPNPNVRDITRLLHTEIVRHYFVPTQEPGGSRPPSCELLSCFDEISRRHTDLQNAICASRRRARPGVVAARHTSLGGLGLLRL